MPHDLYLIAHVVNAISYEAAEVNFEVATKHVDGWYTNDGIHVLPFWTIPLGALMHDTDESAHEIVPVRTLDEVPAIPEGWIEYIHDEARKAVHGRRIDISALLPKAQVPTIRRRI